jgi:DNA-binding beta-propeller fold protein YncE
LRFFAALGLVLSLAAAPPGTQVASSVVPGPPSALALSRDGKTLYVGIDRQQGHGGGLEVYARDGGTLRSIARVDVPGGTAGLALSPDGSTLVVATRVGLAAVSTQALLAGNVRRLDVVRDSDAPRTNQVVLSPDGKYAFATNSGTATLGVARVTNGATPSIEYVSHVALDPSPDGLAMSPDGSTIYVASEVADGGSNAVPGANDPHVGRASCAVNLGWNGVLSAVDVQKAISDPSHAVLGRIAAGCAPARVAVSPDGRVVWVSLRGDGRVVAYDALKLRSEPDRAVLADVKVGAAPIGLAFSADGADLLVANSAGGDDSDDAQAASLSVVDVRSALSGGAGVRATIPTDKLARVVLYASNGVFFVTVYGAKAVDTVSVSLERNDRT